MAPVPTLIQTSGRGLFLLGFVEDLQKARGIAALLGIVSQISLVPDLSAPVRVAIDAVLKAYGAVVFFFVLLGYVPMTSLQRSGIRGCSLLALLILGSIAASALLVNRPGGLWALCGFIALSSFATALLSYRLFEAPLVRRDKVLTATLRKNRALLP